MTSLAMLQDRAEGALYQHLERLVLPHFRAHAVIVYGRRREAGGGWGQATLYHHAGLDERLLPGFCDYYHLKNVWARNEARMREGRAVASSALFPDDQLKRTEYWSGWLRHQDVHYAIGGVIASDGRQQVKASFLRSERAGPYDASELAACQRLMPQLETLWRYQQEMQALRAAARRLEGTMRQLLGQQDPVDELPPPSRHGSVRRGLGLLTAAEREVLDQLVLGHSVKATARLRGASEATVRSQVSAILHKTAQDSQRSLLSSLLLVGYRPEVAPTGPAASLHRAAAPPSVAPPVG